MESTNLFQDCPDIEANLYHVIGCGRESNIEQIQVEYKIRALECHPDKNPGDYEAEKRFKQLQEAKNILSDPETRSKYDKWLNSGVRISFQKWMAITQAGQTFHWVKNPICNPMIQEKDPQDSVMAATSSVRPISRQEWEPESSPWLNKFRNYDI